MSEGRGPQVYTARGQVDGEDWRAVADALNQRMAARRIGQQELAQLSGVSVSTLRQVQHGAGRRVQNKTLAAISRALDWPDDHLSGVLLRGSPAQAVAGEPGGSVLAALEGLTELVEDRFREVGERLAAVERALVRPAAGQVRRPGDPRRPM